MRDLPPLRWYGLEIPPHLVPGDEDEPENAEWILPAGEGLAHYVTVIEHPARDDSRGYCEAWVTIAGFTGYVLERQPQEALDAATAALERRVGEYLALVGALKLRAAAAKIAKAEELASEMVRS